MEKIGIIIDDAHRRVTAMVTISRWIWIVNSLVGLGAIYYHRYDVAALASFTWVFSLVAAAFGQRTAKHLMAAARTVEPGPRYSQWM